jgi:uncharacterized repeat protein (TIGR01451 family)
MSDEEGVVMKNLMAAVLLTMIFALPAFAEEEGSLNVTTTVQKQVVIENDAGESETQLVAADTVVPGETVVYTISFRNIGDEPATNVVITNPIAETLTYVDGSAFGPGTDIKFSTDGGRTYAAADELTVEEDGVSRPAGPDDFTHVQWVMQHALAVGTQGTARFMAVLK